MYAIALLISGSTLLSSCIGSFGLWNGLRNWNTGLGSKFANEAVFLAFHIVPVYPIAYLADILVLNSIEFWSGDNPVASRVGDVKEVKGEDGKNYLVTTTENGYTIAREGEEEKAIELIYNEERDSWSVQSGNDVVELIQRNENGTYSVTQPSGEVITVRPDAVGMSALRMAAMKSATQQMN